jgi:hypothetical protein
MVIKPIRATMDQNPTTYPVEDQAVPPAVVEKKRRKKRKKDPSLPKGPRYVLGFTNCLLIRS